MNFSPAIYPPYIPSEETNPVSGRCKRVMIFILNVLIILFAIRQIFFEGNLHCQSQTVFFTGMTWNHVGIFFLVISVVGIFALCCNFVALSRIYLGVLLILIIILFTFIIFGFVVTKGANGEEIEGKAYKEYRLQSYSSALQTRVATASWNSSKACLVDRKICKSLIDLTDVNLAQFNSMRLSPLQSGCCKPSNDCEFKYVTPTNWTKPTNIDMTSNTTWNDDCGLWSNDRKELCYDCDACKAGKLQSVKDHWRSGAIIKIIFCCFLILVFIVGCCSMPWSNEFDPNGFEADFYRGCLPATGSAAGSAAGCCC